MPIHGFTWTSVQPLLPKQGPSMNNVSTMLIKVVLFRDSLETGVKIAE